MKFNRLPLESVEYRLALDPPYLPVGNRFLAFFLEQFIGPYPEILDADGIEFPPGAKRIVNPMATSITFANPENGLSIRFQPDMIRFAWYRQNAETETYPRFGKMSEELARIAGMIEQGIGEQLKVTAAQLKYTQVLVGDRTQNTQQLAAYFSTAVWPTLLGIAETVQTAEVAFRLPNGIDLRHSVNAGMSKGVAGYVVAETGGKNLETEEQWLAVLTDVHTAMENMKQLTMSEIAKEEFEYDGS